jgi:hypothetical protein
LNHNAIDSAGPPNIDVVIAKGRHIRTSGE